MPIDGYTTVTVKEDLIKRLERLRKSRGLTSVPKVIEQLAEEAERA